jgi:hypothetical protein
MDPNMHEIGFFREICEFMRYPVINEKDTAGFGPVVISIQNKIRSAGNCHQDFTVGVAFNP